MPKPDKASKTSDVSRPERRKGKRAEQHHGSRYCDECRGNGLAAEVHQVQQPKFSAERWLLHLDKGVITTQSECGRLTIQSRSRGRPGLLRRSRSSQPDFGDLHTATVGNGAS